MAGLRAPDRPAPRTDSVSLETPQSSGSSWPLILVDIGWISLDDSRVMTLSSGGGDTHFGEELGAPTASSRSFAPTTLFIYVDCVWVPSIC